MSVKLRTESSFNSPTTVIFSPICFVQVAGYPAIAFGCNMGKNGLFFVHKSIRYVPMGLQNSLHVSIGPKSRHRSP